MQSFKFQIDGKPYQTEVISAEGNIVEMLVNGKKYSVEVEQDITAPISVAPAAKTTPSSAPQQAASTVSSGETQTVKSPLPGSIVKIVANEGTAVKEGDVLLIMESMKMENNITAEVAGIVRKVYVSVSQTVMQDDPLVDIG
ncbi:MAG: biotin/lipoyl-binding protein [Paludibacter sp.]|nr:biotin/lipoyl-binding protein [Paludibacter sp.]